MWLLLLYDTTRLHTGLNVRPTVLNVCFRETSRASSAADTAKDARVAAPCRERPRTPSDLFESSMVRCKIQRQFATRGLSKLPPLMHAQRDHQKENPLLGCLYWALLCIHFYPPILIFFKLAETHFISFFCNFLVQCGVVVDSATSQSSARIESKTKAHRAQTRSCTLSSSVEDQAALTPLELSRRDKNDTMDWKQCNDFID